MIRLYYTEPARREFDAIVTHVEPLESGAELRVRLDRTAFYPTSGGQPHDTGALGGVRVVDVIEDETTGEIDHVVAGRVEVGERVHGIIDWDRRADHMQQHTGQHVLSSAFDRLHQARTVSFHLGATASTVDLSREATAAEVASAESEANRIVWENRPVSIRFVSADEATRLPLRKEPARGGRLRLIDIEGFDLSACGGTHVSRTGEIGTIAVLGTERFKGGTRVEFACGSRALDAWRRHREAVVASVRLVSTLPDQLPAGIERLLAENKEVKRSLKLLSQKLAGYEGKALADSAEQVGSLHLVVRAVDGYDANGLKLLALGIVERPDVVAVLFSTERPALVVAARGADDTTNCQALVQALFQEFGGRGGGRSELAQGGGLDAPTAALIDAARTLIGESPAGKP